MKSFLINLICKVNKFLLEGDAEVTYSDYNSSVSPIYDFLDTFGPFIISIILCLGVIYCIVLMVRYVKEEDAGKRDGVTKQAINAVISVGVVLLLIVLLYALRGMFISAMNDTN